MGTYKIAENAPALLDGLSFEEVLSEQPDFIFISTMGKEEAARAYMDSVLAEESWQGLTAVQGGNYALSLIHIIENNGFKMLLVAAGQRHLYGQL